MHHSNSYLIVRGIAARIVRAILTRNREKDTMSAPLTVKDYEAGDYLLKLLAMDETRTMLAKSSNMTLSGLAVFQYRGITWTKGRLGASMKRILEAGMLVVLSPESRLAWLIMMQCHQEDHR